MSNKEGVDIDIMQQEGREEARQDATMQRLDNDETRTRDEMQQRGGAMQGDWALDDKGQRDNTTTNQTNKQTDEHTNKAGAT
jgi:hypothetical protein